MNKIICLALLASSACFGQISGAGQIGCGGATVTGTGWTSATANNSTQALATNVPIPFVQVELVQGTTITGGAVTFQGNPGDGTFINIPVAQVLAAGTYAQLTNPYTLIQSTNQVFIISMSGFVSLQLKLTSVITGTGTITPYTTAICYTPIFALNAAGGIKTDGSAVTQPVSAASLPLPTGAAISANQPGIGTAGAAHANVATVQGIAGMTKLLVTPDSVALPANQSVNVAQVAGTATDTNSGVKSAGTIRVVLATDQPALTNKLLVTPDSVALPANQSVNAAQINGVTPLMGNGVAGTGSPRVTIASDNTAFPVNATVTQATASNLKAQVNQLASISTSGTLQSAAVANGNGTLLTVDGMAAVILTVNCATCSGGTAINFEGTEDATNFTSLTGVLMGSNTLATSTTTAGITVWEFPAAGLVSVRARISAYSAGTVTVTGHTVPVTYSPKVVNANVVSSIPAGTAVIGHVIVDTTSTTAVTQATAANLNAAVVGTGTAGAPAGNILTVQGVASMTKLLVTPDSVALPANQSVNVAQVGGTNTVTGGVAGIIAVGGNVANAVAATANPVPVGGIFTTAPTTLTTGQTATAQFTAAQNLKHDITTIAGTAPTTVGKLDVKGADGDVFVRQATAANLNATVVGTLGDNVAAAATNRVGTVSAIAQSNMPAAATAGRDVALRTDLRGNLLVSPVPNGLTTYAASKQGLVPAATPTDLAVLPGNATNTVIVTGVSMSCTQTTAGIIDVQLIKRSTADTAGTSAAMTVVPLDSGNAAAVSAPLTYTANPTTGTAVGNIDTQKIGVLAPATATASDMYLWRPSMGQSVTLRGTAQQLAINLNSVTLTGGSCDINFSFIETTGL